MSFYISTAANGQHLRLETGPAVTLLDDSLQPMSATFKPIDDYSCAASVESNVFVIGYWKADLRVFDLALGEQKATFPFKDVGALAAFDPTGTRLLFQTGSKIVLLNIDTSESVQVKGVRGLGCAIPTSEGNAVIVPSQKKDELLSISLQTGDVSVVPLPFGATLFELSASPCGQNLIAIDRKKGIHCINPSDWSIIWSQSFKKILGKDHMGVGHFSGDGTLFGASVAARDHNYTLVVDAHTGQQTGRFDSVGEGIPYRGTLMRDSETQRDTFDFETLDLANGKAGTGSLIGVDG